MTESVEINEIRLSILGMSCAGCVGSVEAAISSVEGVVSVEVNFADHSANVKATVSPD
ncbi:MAG: cation transporter, partial [Methylococcales bacterium]|nr:cation transporter [Methylococcales bacterium]